MPTNPLGQTQRDVIRQYDRERERETSFTNIEHHDPDQTSLKEVYQNGRVESGESENRRNTEHRYPPLWPKLLAFILALLVVIGAVVALIWFYKNDNPVADVGSITATTVKPPVCPDIVLGLNHELVFVCNKKQTGTVNATFVNQAHITGEDVGRFICKDNNDNKTTCTYTKPVSCATRGKIRVDFYDSFDKKSRKLNDTKFLELKVYARKPTVDITAEYNDEGEIENFHLSCSQEKQCTNYPMTFVAGDRELTEHINCSTTFENEFGYTTVCQATISSDDMYNHGNGSRIYCKIGDEKHEFYFSSCSDFNTNDDDCKRGSSLFSCDGDDAIDKLNDEEHCDTARCDLLETCFKYRLVELEDGPCQDRNCALNWCRHDTTLALDRSGEIPFKELLCD